MVEKKNRKFNSVEHHAYRNEQRHDCLTQTLIANSLFFPCVLDRFTQHRYKADQAFELDGSKSPVAQYLDIDTIVSICETNGVEAVHPG